MKYKYILIILLVGVLFVCLGAQCPWQKDKSGSSMPSPDSVIPGTWAWDGTNWTLLTPANEPGPRGDHAMVYDSARQRIVLFGGSTYDFNIGSWVYLNDTWEWDGTDWLQHYSTVTPTARNLHAMAYDSLRGKTVLFGGVGTGVQNNESWEWDGTNRTLKDYTLDPAGDIDTPSWRDAPAMAYDAARGKVVLFGGYNIPTKTRLGDTWEYDGTNWTQRFPANSPPPRNHFAMAYDSARQKIVIFGGIVGQDPAGGGDDTWEWDGTNWIGISLINSPISRSNHAMAYDSFRQKTVLYGGVPADVFYPYALVWEYDGTNWTSIISSTRPGGRQFGASMVYDSVRKRVIMWR
ncbi:MAG: hypothetical protein HY762_04270 [Planctomycetes bacterium]|nr:hypothetical protein [Planctomycetota bacterium]